MDQTTLARIRTLLAAERTFAAWLRTGLASIGGGLVLIKLVPFRNLERQWVAQVVGQLLILGGSALFILALLNYQRSHKALVGAGEGIEGVEHPPLWMFVAITGLLVVVGLLVLWLTL